MAFLYSVLYVAAIGIASHFIGEALPRRWFHYDKFPYRVWKWERGGKIYDALRIRAWKDRVPDMSRIMKDMVPKRVGKTPRAADVWRLVQETCVAEIVHVALCLCAPVIWLFWGNWIGILLGGIFVICNLPFIMIQRYNRLPLASLAERLEKREERRRKAAEQEQTAE
ncbi:MAG: hypothetical protein IKJ35_03710 [Clostridia bacterium]|nr:hypothetical protein [Clostridia bacterium]